MPRKNLMRFSASNSQEHAEALRILRESGARVAGIDETDGAFLTFYRQPQGLAPTGEYAQVFEKSFSCAPAQPISPAGDSKYL